MQPMWKPLPYQPAIAAQKPVTQPRLGLDLGLTPAILVLTGSVMLLGGVGAYYAYTADTTFGYVSAAALTVLSLFGTVNFADTLAREIF